MELIRPELVSWPPLIDGDLTLRLAARLPAEPSLDLVPAYRFSLRLTATDEPVGQIDLRIGNTERLRRYGGHIGYGVDAPYRGRHFAARACRLLRPVARHHGLRELWITCDPDNLASRRTCEWAGATFVEIVDVPPDSDMYLRGERQKCRYWLPL
ncbi:MAG: GNAT family N-acetyltransferase [Opitutales bacterium]